MERRQRRFDWWMWTTLVVALLCFSIGALTFNASGGRSIAGIGFSLGFAALLSFFLRMYYRTTIKMMVKQCPAPNPSTAPGSNVHLGGLLVADVGSLARGHGMRLFWITYMIATLGLLAFCYSFLGVLPLCVAVTAGAGVGAVWLIWKREALRRQRHMIFIAVLASVSGVGLGFIVIFILSLAGSILR